jgi:hypothetical protein
MRTNRRFFALFTLIILSVTVIFAQTTTNEPVKLSGDSTKSLPSRFIIFGGAAIPVGDFAKEDGGGAKTGFSLGAKFVTGGRIGFLIDASYSANSTENTILSWPYRTTIGSGGWSSILILAGLKIGTTNPLGANFFFAPVLGLNIAHAAEKTGRISDTYQGYSYPYSYSVPITGTLKLESASGTAFTYGATAEAIIGSMTIGARYISGIPKLDHKGEYSYSGSTTGITISGGGTFESSKVGQSISLILLYIGLAF